MYEISTIWRPCEQALYLGLRMYLGVIDKVILLDQFRVLFRQIRVSFMSVHFVNGVTLYQQTDPALIYGLCG
jgi:hypothetical protein